MGTVKKKWFWYLVMKIVSKTAAGGERDWAQLWIQQGEVGIYSQEAEWGGVQEVDYY